MAAEILNEALNYLEPLQPLIFDPQATNVSQAASQQLYVERPDSPLDQLKLDLLKSPGRSHKALLTGHLGCGKSTELNRLAADPEIIKQFLVVKYNVQDVVNLVDRGTDYTDFLLSLCSVLFTRVSQDLLTEPVLKRAQRWIEDISSNEGLERLQIRSEDPLWKRVSGFFENIVTVLTLEINTRAHLRDLVGRNLSELIKLINFLIERVQAQLEDSNRELLVIVDDLEKIPDINLTRQLFVEAATYMASPSCKIIYTLPNALYYSTDIQIVADRIGEPYSLGNIRLFRSRDGDPDPEGFGFMKKFIGNRIRLNLIEEDACQTAISFSGGVVRDLVRILRKSVIHALEEEQKVISQDHVEAVVIQLRSEYYRALDASHYRVAGQVIAGEAVAPEDRIKMMELYSNRSLLEYQNGDCWSMPHPIAEPLFRKYLESQSRKQSDN